MTIPCDKHVFSHQGRYRTTLMSPLLSQDELTELEQYQFGQTNDETYLSTLDRNPGLIFRPLRSGRYAMTRVFRGANDDKGRPTLVFITLVVLREHWTRMLSHNIVDILTTSAPVWDQQASRVSIQAPRPFAFGKGYDVAVADELANTLNASADSGTRVMAYADAVTLGILAHVTATMPESSIRDFSFAYRSMSDALAVSLNCVERTYARSGSPYPRNWYQGISKALSAPSRNLVAGRTSLPARSIDGEHKGGVSASIYTATDYGEPIVSDNYRENGHVALPVIAAVTVIAFVMTLFSYFSIRGQLHSIASRQARIEESFTSQAGRVGAQESQYSPRDIILPVNDKLGEILKKMEANAGVLNSLQTSQKAMGERLTTLETNMNESGKVVADIHSRLATTRPSEDQSADSGKEK